MDSTILLAGVTSLYTIILLIVIYKDSKGIKAQKEQTDYWFKKALQYSDDVFDQYNIHIYEILDLQKQVRELEGKNTQLKAQVDEYWRQSVEMRMFLK